MSREYNEDLDIPQGIFASNWIWGNVIVTPTANEVTSVDITGLNVVGDGEIRCQASVKSAYPWVSAGYVGIGTFGEEGEILPWEESTNQIRITFFRTNDSETRIHWMVWRDSTGG